MPRRPDDGDDRRRQDRPERPAAQSADREHAHAGALAAARGRRRSSRSARPRGGTSRRRSRRSRARRRWREYDVELARRARCRWRRGTCRPASSSSRGCDRRRRRAAAAGTTSRCSRTAAGRLPPRSCSRGRATRNGSSAGTVPCGEIDAQMAEREHAQAAAIQPARRRRGDGAHRTPRLTGYEPSTCSSALRSDTSLSARSTRGAERWPTTSM